MLMNLTKQDQPGTEFGQTNSYHFFSGGLKILF